MTDPTGVEGRPEPFRDWLSLYTRICVTGSRNYLWTDEIHYALIEVERVDFGKPKLLIVGGSGAADVSAEMSARSLGWDTCVIRPDWDRYGKKAGYIRNRSMIRLKPHLVLAFIRDESPGATMTARLAEDAGIPVWYRRHNKPRTLRGWIDSAGASASRSKQADLTAVARSLARST